MKALSDRVILCVCVFGSIQLCRFDSILSRSKKKMYISLNYFRNKNVNRKIHISYIHVVVKISIEELETSASTETP